MVVIVSILVRILVMNFEFRSPASEDQIADEVYDE